MYKWFGLDPIPCAACEVLKESLSLERQLNKVLLDKLLDKDKTEPTPLPKEEYKPINPQFTPWRVRQQMLEAEDRKQAELIKAKQREMKEIRDASIDKLEKELGVDDASQIS